MSCNHHWVLERYKGTYCLKCDISAVDVIDDLRAKLAAAETKIRKAYLNTDNLPSFLRKQREKPIDEIIDILAYHEDQYWEIVGILANYPTLQKAGEDLSDAIGRLVDLFDMAEKDRNNLLERLAEWKEIAATEQDKWAESVVENQQLQAHNALLVGALRKIKEAKSGTAVMAHIAFNALESTPAEAYERIRGLVEALEEVRKQCLDDHLCKFYGWFHVQEKADNALQRYRGGESNV